MQDWQSDLACVLLTEEQISERVRQLAGEIAGDYASRNPLLIGVLKGSIIFLADLIRALDMPLEVDLMCASSYGQGADSSGAVNLLKDISQDVQGRHVLIVEDIIDTGRTLSRLLSMMRKRGAASVAACCLLSKPARREVAVEVRYTGFEIPNEFVVGYGLDYAERFRGLPYVAVLKPEAYQSQ